MKKDDLAENINKIKEKAANKDPQVVTFGCRLNVHESEVMRDHARNAGLQDVIIFNTCAVTKEAERQARQAIRRAKRENPDAQIVVTGCSAQVNPKQYADMKEVDRVLGNDLKLQAESWGAPIHERILVNDIMSVKETAGHLIDGYEDRTRAFLQVQNGCDHRCTFCIIPYGRGNSRSVPIGVIAKQVHTLVEAGNKEIVFTGVDVTSYGQDLPGAPSLGQMIRRVLALVPELARVRLSSLDPVEIDNDLWRLIAEESRFMPHLHLSVQAGDDLILKRMKRRHSRQDVIDVCKKAKALRPEMAFGADIIAGFPTETDAMFENTLRLVEECGLTFLHVFPYSEREGTPAAKMPQVNPAIRKKRAAQLRTLRSSQMQKFLAANVGREVEVLVEKDGMGRAENFASVQLDQALEIGSLAFVRIEGVLDEILSGTVLSGILPTRLEQRA